MTLALDQSVSQASPLARLLSSASPSAEANSDAAGDAPQFSSFMGIYAPAATAGADRAPEPGETADGQHTADAALDGILLALPGLTDGTAADQEPATDLPDLLTSLAAMTRRMAIKDKAATDVPATTITVETEAEATPADTADAALAAAQLGLVADAKAASTTGVAAKAPTEAPFHLTQSVAAPVLKTADQINSGKATGPQQPAATVALAQVQVPAQAPQADPDLTELPPEMQTLSKDATAKALAKGAKEADTAPADTAEQAPAKPAPQLVQGTPRPVAPELAANPVIKAAVETIARPGRGSAKSDDSKVLAAKPETGASPAVTAPQFATSDLRDARPEAPAGRASPAEFTSAISAKAGSGQQPVPELKVAEAAAPQSDAVFTMPPPDAAGLTQAVDTPDAAPAAAKLADLPQTPISTESPDWHAEMVERITSQVTGDGASIDIALTPENLGRVEVKVEIRNGNAEVSFTTETREAAKLFNQAEQQLSDLLQRNGLNLAQQDSQQRGNARAGQTDTRLAAQNDAPQDTTENADQPKNTGQVNLMA